MRHNRRNDEDYIEDYEQMYDDGIVSGMDDDEPVHMMAPIDGDDDDDDDHDNVDDDDLPDEDRYRIDEDGRSLSLSSSPPKYVVSPPSTDSSFVFGDMADSDDLSDHPTANHRNRPVLKSVSFDDEDELLAGTTNNNNNTTNSSNNTTVSSTTATNNNNSNNIIPITNSATGMQAIPEDIPFVPPATMRVPYDPNQSQLPSVGSGGLMAIPTIPSPPPSTPPSSPPVRPIPSYPSPSTTPPKLYTIHSNSQTSSFSPTIILPESHNFASSNNNGNQPNGSVVSRQTTAVNNNSNFVWGLSKPVFSILAFYLLFMTGSFCYFLSQYIKIPGLNDQIDELEMQVNQLEEKVFELEQQVDRLESQVDLLSAENDKYEALNAELEFQNQDYAALNERFQAINGAYQNLTLEFNTTVTEFETKVDTLELQVNQAKNVTSQLNGTVANLTIANEELRNNTNALQTKVETLNQTLQNTTIANLELNATVTNLTASVVTLQNASDTYAAQVDSLTNIVSYLDETNSNGNATFTELATQLSSQITTNRGLVLEQLQNTYLQRVQTWNCAFFNVFAGKSFISNLDSPLGSTNFETVLTNVEDDVLEELCLNRTNLESFLDATYVQGGSAGTLVNVTTNDVISGVSTYTADALNYYFPDQSNGTGLTSLEWADASYDCTNLPSNLQFSTANR